ncbi:MAG: MMPL family transporter [Oscillospiraceae bacterium]|nr:MMPL family transporter [Oscillospiraceae bacterium]
MLKKAANFIVDKRILLLVLLLVVTVVSAVGWFMVDVNSDMTKYLPDDSNMKVGMDIMDGAFPEIETANTIRVMFDDLSQEEKASVLAKLSAIEYVDSVDHDPDSVSYNKDNHTLFVINMSCDYGSEGEKAIEAALKEQFAEYTVIWQNDEAMSPGIPVIVYIVVMIIAIVILCVMCSAWIEPLMILFVTGVAVVINGGSNYLLGSVSDVTHSITAILQMALSMDYSIILMNRYRQEREHESDRKKAMKIAWANAFSSVASSSLTTVVGLLMLVFMSFKIGADLGVVLAKGVFISMVCVLTIMPGIIISFDNLIKKTAKKELHIRMDWAAAFSYKMRYGVTGLFVVIFAAFCLLQSKTGITYTMSKDDLVAEVFPKSNMVVMLYENHDEDNLGELLDKLEEDERVTSAMSYGTVLGKPYTSEELVDVIGDMSDGASFDPAMIDLLYYDYYAGGELGTMTAGEFLAFLSNDVMGNDAFSAHIDEAMLENKDLIDRFADADALQQPMTADELAEMFGIEADDVKDLFLLYQIENDVVSDSSMTLAEFADFVINDVATDAVYGEMFDEAALNELTQLAVFTDAEKMTTPYTYEGIAEVLGMDAETAKLLFVYYCSLDDNYEPAAMTLPEFIGFLTNDIATHPVFSAYLDSDTMQQMQTLSVFTNAEALKKQRVPAEIAAMLGVDEEMVKTIFVLHNAQDVSGKAMSLSSFTGFVNGYLLNNPMFAASFDEASKAQLQTVNSLVQMVVSGREVDAATMAKLLGMDENAVKQLYYLYFSADAGFGREVAAMKMPLMDFLTLLKANTPAEQQAQLVQMEQLLGVAMYGQELTAAELAGITGMPEEQISQLFAMKGVERMGLTSFLDVALMMDSGNMQIKQLKQLIGLAVSGAAQDSATLAGVFGIEQMQVMQLFGLELAAQKTIPLANFTAFLVNDVMSNEAYGAGFTAEQKAQLAQMDQLVQLAAYGVDVDAATLAQAFGMDESLVNVVFRLYFGQDIANKTMSLEETVGFILADAVMSSYMDAETIAQLQMIQQLSAAAVSGTRFDYKGLAQMLNMDSGNLKTMFTLRSAAAEINDWSMSVHGAVNFLVDNKESVGAMMDDEQLTKLSTAQAIINGAVEETTYTAEQIAALTGMSEDQANQLYLLYTSERGAADRKLSVKQFVDFVLESVLSNAEYADMMDADSREMLTSAKTMIDAVIGGEEYAAQEMSNIFSGFADEMDANTAELLYLYAASLRNADPAWTMSLETLFNYMVDNVLEDPRFDTFIDGEMRDSLLENQSALEDGKTQLVADEYSRLILSTTYLSEGDATTEFIAGLEEYAENNIDGKVYLIGDSPMAYEMQQTFGGELLFITPLTAFAIFLIVALTFKSLSIPIILVLLVQSGVYITVTVTGIISGSMYYLALLIVECILMGATIDYGILFTNYYREYRKSVSVKEALKKAYDGSIHTVMTSGLILVLVTAAVGKLFGDETIEAIVKTISIGSFCAIILILFILPGVLATCDKIVVGKKNRSENMN